MIDEFGLGFNLGQTLFFVLDREDGGERENLVMAREYLDRAITRLEA